MESPKLGIPNPTKKKVDEALEGIERASEDDSRLEAERLGISVEEFDKRPTEIPTGYKDIQYTDHSKEESQVLDIKDFLNKWEKEHATEGGGQKEQLPENINIVNKTTYHISRFFISSVLKEAVKEMRTNYYFKKYNPVIYGFNEISKITVESPQDGKKLHFEIYVNKRSMIFKKQKYVVMFNVDLYGNIILP